MSNPAHVYGVYVDTVPDLEQIFAGDHADVQESARPLMNCTFCTLVYSVFYSLLEVL